MLSEELCKICRVIHTKLDDGGAATRYVGEYHVLPICHKLAECIGKLVGEKLADVGSVIALHTVEELIRDGSLFSILIAKNLEVPLNKMGLKILANAGASMKWLGAQRAV